VHYTTETKAQIIKGITQVLVDVLRMDPQVVSVTIEEVDTDNWGKGGETLTVRLKKAK
jgi:4-oxalocrotonate tautomerase